MTLLTFNASDEELLDALDDVDAGEQSTLVTADGETTLPEDQSTEDANDTEDGTEDLDDGGSEGEDLEDAVGAEEGDPDPVEVAPTEEG